MNLAKVMNNLQMCAHFLPAGTETDVAGSGKEEQTHQTINRETGGFAQNALRKPQELCTASRQGCLR